MNESIMTDSLKTALEAIDNVFDGIDRNYRENFWNNREPKQRVTKQERDTINVLNGFIPAVNKEPSSVKPVEKQRHRQSSTVTARG
ncbi:hypothetical protein KKI90_22215 [Xenorhabdus bovienii]|uniref:hypothetical protein n=1 Tax=Xenorhabdus bovienii TaxID=40576 RepID=UPI00237C6BB7|nr:hypothetical protein [Xenorhabdus bovienii]MDE9479815.1 hypothetical protein [Xenorhabdus bovienii]MDE9532743.1 hypothetical protein [Xenorhabdus bovienii]